MTIRWPANFASDPTTPRTLYIFLHPYESTASALTFQSDYGFGTVEDDENALSIAPLGTMDTSNDRYWNATGGCCDLDANGSDDKLYLGTLIDQIIAAGWPVNRHKVFIIGASNGAFMAQRLADYRDDLITGIWASAGAAMTTSAFGGTDPSYVLTNKVAVLESHGTSDGTIAYAGGTFGTMPLPYPSVRGVAGTNNAPTANGTLRQWMDANGCATTMTTGATVDYDSAVVGSETIIYDADTCPTNSAVEHWRVVGGAHSPSYNATARTAAKAWLNANANR